MGKKAELKSDLAALKDYITSKYPDDKYLIALYNITLQSVKVNSVVDSWKAIEPIKMYERGGVTGEVYSIENPEQFKEVLNLYNTLSEDFGFERYYVDKIDSSVVFMKSESISDYELDAITTSIYDLDEQGYEIFDTNRISFIKKDGELKIGLKDIVTFSNGGKISHDHLNSIQSLLKKYNGKI